MNIVLLTADLMTSSQLAAAAQREGYAAETSGSAAAAVESCGRQTVDLLVLDLSLPGLDSAALVESLRTSDTPPGAIIAFGPHVHEKKLQAARDAGCDQVLSRGQFFSQAADVYRQFAQQD